MEIEKLEVNESVFSVLQEHLLFVSAVVTDSELKVVCSDLPELHMGPVPVYILNFEDSKGKLRSLLVCHDGSFIQLYEVKGNIPKLADFIHPMKDPYYDYKPMATFDLTNFTSPFDPSAIPYVFTKKATIVRLLSNEIVGLLIWLDIGTNLAFIIGDNSELMCLLGDNINVAYNHALAHCESKKLIVESKIFNTEFQGNIGSCGFFDICLTK